MPSAPASDGHTRAAHRHNYLLQTPDTFVRTPMPGVAGGQTIVHACAALGAKFLMFTLELEPGGTFVAGGDTRLLYVLAGEGTLGRQTLQPGQYAYRSAEDERLLTAITALRCVVFDKPYEPLPAIAPPTSFFGCERDLTPMPLNGDPVLLVRALLPPGFAFDFAVNTMEYAPGAALGQVEIHYMEHGLLMLEGSGQYRLGDDFHPIAAGDFVWMAPFCPQWFQASADGSAKYLIYKNFNRVPQP